jgi:hypothetical protein
MSEWGLPDWQDGSGYEVTGRTINAWRWEFLRRRPDLREEFLAKAARRFEQQLELSKASPDLYCGSGPLTPDEPGFFVTTSKIHGGLEKLPNPRISEQPFQVISWQDLGASWTQFSSEKPPQDYLRFDLDVNSPIEAQLAVVRDAMKEFQQNKFGKLAQNRRRPSKWPLYLRVLDAREAGASWSEIATILRHTAGTEQTARDVHYQANALCFNF